MLIQDDNNFIKYFFDDINTTSTKHILEVLKNQNDQFILFLLDIL